MPALGTHPTFIDDLAAMVLEKLPSAAPRPGYLASTNEGINLGPPSGAQPSHLQQHLAPAGQLLRLQRQHALCVRPCHGGLA